MHISNECYLKLMGALRAWCYSNDSLIPVANCLGVGFATLKSVLLRSGLCDVQGKADNECYPQDVINLVLINGLTMLAEKKADKYVNL